MNLLDCFRMPSTGWQDKFMNNNIIAEGSIPLPVSLSIRKQTGDRFQLIVYNTVEDETHETCFNFYGQESLNMRIDKKNLVVEIKKGQK